MTLAQDPSYLAWMRALGFEEDNARANTERQRGQIEDRVAFERPELEFQGEEARRGISGSYESRGLFRSGSHERGLANQRRGEVAEVGRLEMGGANQIADLEMSLATQIAALQRQQAEQALTTGASIYREEGLMPYKY